MNILPKKRWHVRTKDNIARVRKDEAAAREEEQKKQDKLKLAESEARVNFLRKCSGIPEKHHKESGEDKSLTSKASTSLHVDLFSDYKHHVKTTNKELEKEKKEEQEKYEKKIGYLTYLGQDTNEALRLKSWYEVAPKRLTIEPESGIKNENDVKIKLNHDPLTFIKSILPPDPNHNTKPFKKRKRGSSPQITIHKEELSKLSKKSKKIGKKHKKSKHKKSSKEHKEKSREKDEHDRTRKLLKIELLRKERIRREATERARQEALLAPKESSKTDISNNSKPKIIQKYNSQFNPELAKQNLN